MITVQSLAEAAAHLKEGCCLTIGNFDGLHMGHRHLLARTRQKANEQGLPCVVLCFWPHPLRVLAAAHAPPLLAGRRQRQDLLAGQAVDLCLELPFTPEFARLSPAEFTQQVLVPLGTRELVIGYDFSLGRKRAGNAAVLAALGLEHGFGVEQLAPVIVGDAVASSTRVRDLLRAGKVWEAQALLGRFHSICGSVVHGRAVGTSLGFPTANLGPVENILPKNGVYACRARVADKLWPAVTNIGVKPSFGEQAHGVESFLLDADLDLYASEMELFFVQRLRDEQCFASIDALRWRIAQDVELTRAVLSLPETRPAKE